MASCPSCASTVSETARFCPTCGASLQAACPNCGSPVQATSRFCETCGHALRPALATAEERKLVSILFADVTGSTALGERLDPERLRSVLSTYFSGMSAVIESWGGTVEKFIGDAIMAVFGAPVVREDDAERALRAALDMLWRLDELNGELRERHGVELKIRIGVNTGEVIAPVGVPVEQMIVVGDAVNVAARLEQAAEPGTVLVGEPTYLATRDAFEFGEPTALDLKGKAEPVGARRLLAVRTEATRGIPGLSAAMVGRDLELESLLRLVADSETAGRPRMVTVFGPAGIGKSRLVSEFLRLASSRDPAPTVFRGRCLAAGPGITYWALGEILRAACGISLADPAAAARRKLGNCGELLEHLGLSEAETEMTIFALATTSGLVVPGNPLDAMEPQDVAEELARAWPRFATALASRAPTILVIEDLHWASDRLLELVERLVTRSTGPLLLVATARPEFARDRPGFGGGAEELSSISLRPLTEEQGSELVASLLSEAELPPSLGEGILDKAEGNPFFLEELLRRLIDEGAIVRADDRWVVTEAAHHVALPETVQGLLGARIDALEPAEKRVLQEAAVIGRVFWQAPVELAAGNGEVSSSLSELERKGLIFARPVSSLAGQVEYMFKHALVREVAYGGLPKARRARAHAEHAAWIEDLAGERAEEFADLLAYHYEQAVSGEDADLAWAGDEAGFAALRSRAFDALLLGGRSARKRSAFDRAVELHERAVEIGGSDAERAVALEALARDHDAAYHGEEGFAAYLQALELVRAGAGTVADRARLCMRAARLSVKIGPFKEIPPPELSEQLVDEGFASDPDPTTRAWLLNLKGQVTFVYERFERADPVGIDARISAGETALAMAEDLGDPELISESAQGLSGLYEEQSDLPRALEAMWRIGDVVDQIASPMARGEAMLRLAAMLISAGRYGEANDYAAHVYELGRDASTHAHLHGTGLRIVCAFFLGRWDELDELTEEHAGLFPEIAGVPCGFVNGGMVCGALGLVRRGEEARARAILEAVPRDQRRPPMYHALTLLELGDLEAALAAGEEGLRRVGVWGVESRLAILEILGAIGDRERLRGELELVRRYGAHLPLLAAVADRADGHLALAEGDSARGVELLRSALAAFERLEVPFEIARTKELLAEAVPSEADRLRADAVATYEALDAAPAVRRVRASTSS